MAEEEKNEAAEGTAPDEDAQPPGAEADEATPDEAPGEEAPQDETAPEPAAAPEAEPEEQLTPKQRRRRERSTFRGQASPPRSPEDRAAERAERRAANAAARRRRRAHERKKREPGTGTPPAERRPGAKKVRQGTVLSSKADKTITVKIEVVRRHPVYEKVVRRSATVRAHDERNEASEGDMVRVIESRPISRTKRWRLVEVMEKAR